MTSPAAERLREHLRAIYARPPRPDPAMDPVELTIRVPLCILRALEQQALELETDPATLAGIRLSSAVFLSAE